MTLVQLYTDGAAKGNPGPGGYGLVLISGAHKKEYAEGFRNTTNNRMELLAVIKGLEMLKKTCQVEVYSDSKYVVDANEKGWLASWISKGLDKRPNADLWARFVEAKKRHRVRFFWVKGHAGHPLNERCDQLAVWAAENDNNRLAPGFESRKG